MLHTALQQPSDQITEKLTKEIRDLGQRTADLDCRMDDIENAFSHDKELELLRDENFTLQTCLEDFENRAQRSNLRIRGIPESITDLQSSMTALFQELSPSIPIERLEFDRIHRALAPHKTEGPPRDNYSIPFLPYQGSAYGRSQD